MIFKSLQKNRDGKNNRGFTLIEMLVSITLFSIVITIVIGTVLTIVDSNRKSQSLAIVMNNLNFAIESMTRDIKTANPTSDSSYSANNLIIDDNTGNNILTLEDSEGRKIVYKHDVTNKTITKNIDDGGDQPILSDDIVVEEFYVSVLGNVSGSQPRVFLFIDGYSQITEKTRSDFTIQTTVSPRKLNIY